MLDALAASRIGVGPPAPSAEARMCAAKGWRRLSRDAMPTTARRFAMTAALSWLRPEERREPVLRPRWPSMFRGRSREGV
jgi:hypothetical protein